MKAAIASVFCVLVLVLGGIWLFTENDYQTRKHYAPKEEQLRRDTYKQSESYNQGMIQELQNMQFDYVQAQTQEQKDALAAIILHRAADYPEEKMPTDLRAFVNQLKQERLKARP